MATHATRLARLFTPEYVCRINAQMVHPARPQLVKPNELESALARPLNVAAYEPGRQTAYFAATLSYGIIAGALVSCVLCRMTVSLNTLHRASVPRW